MNTAHREGLGKHLQVTHAVRHVAVDFILQYQFVVQREVDATLGQLEQILNQVGFRNLDNAARIVEGLIVGIVPDGAYHDTLEVAERLVVEVLVLSLDETDIGLQVGFAVIQVFVAGVAVPGRGKYVIDAQGPALQDPVQ